MPMSNLCHPAARPTCSDLSLEISRHILQRTIRRAPAFGLAPFSAQFSRHRYTSFRTKQADFLFPFTSCEGSACECEDRRPIASRLLRAMNLSSLMPHFLILHGPQKLA